MGRPCFVCGEDTPLALGFAGLWSRLPPDKRGTLPHCKAHEPDAFARRDAASGTSRPTGEQPKPQASGAIPSDPSGADQLKLF